jgi:hypothetical protein
MKENATLPEPLRPVSASMAVQSWTDRKPVGQVVVVLIFWLLSIFLIGSDKGPGGMAGIIMFSIFCVAWEIHALAFQPFRLEIITKARAGDKRGILIIRALVRVIEEIPISTINGVSLPEGPYFGIAWNNWDASRGDVIVEHGTQKTSFPRFDNDEGFVSRVSSLNPAVSVRRNKVRDED